MQLHLRREPTGTYCGGHHPELIEYRYLLVDGVEVPHGQCGPRCLRAGCPDKWLHWLKNSEALGRHSPLTRGRPHSLTADQRKRMLANLDEYGQSASDGGTFQRLRAASEDPEEG